MFHKYMLSDLVKILYGSHYYWYFKIKQYLHDTSNWNSPFENAIYVPNKWYNDMFIYRKI